MVYYSKSEEYMVKFTKENCTVIFSEDGSLMGIQAEMKGNVS